MPAAPVVADKTKHSVTLSWKPPEKDGGSPIKGYIIQIQDEGKSDWMRVNDPDTLHPTTEFTVPSLRELKRHRFRIIAVNDIGESDPSPRTSEVLVEDVQRMSDFSLFAVHFPTPFSAATNFCAPTRQFLRPSASM